MTKVLYITTDADHKVSEDAVRELSGKTVSFLDLSDSGAEVVLPDGWQRLNAADYFDPDAFRTDFINFLEEWPHKPIWKGKSFEQLFRRPSGYSVWWTTVGAYRTPQHTPIPQFKGLWILDRVLSEFRPEVSFIACKVPDFAMALKSRCESIICIPSETHDKSLHYHRCGVAWLVKNSGFQLTVPFRITCVSLISRLISPAIPRDSRAERTKPAILIVPQLARNIRFENGLPVLPSWSDFLSELRYRLPGVRQRVLLRPKLNGGGRKFTSWLKHSGNKLLCNIEGAIPLLQCYTGLVAWFSAVPTQVVSLYRYFRLANTKQYTKSIQFSNANVSFILTPFLRQAVEGIAEWERRTAAYASCIRGIGNLRAVLLLSDFYPGAMCPIAASHRLGIPVIGVQHGTIMPMHLVYTVPPGHLLGAPTPDYFAAYGEYSKEIVSQVGSYPAERVWITGASRLDHLVKAQPNTLLARQRLGLPSDNTFIVLIATQTFSWFPEVVRSVFQFARSRVDCTVCVKTHPGDRKRMVQYQQSAGEFAPLSVRFFEDHIEDLLVACDVLISASSTTILEATLLRKQSICANYSDEPDRYPYVEDGASLAARTDQELYERLQDVLNHVDSHDYDSRKEVFLARHAGPTTHGLASLALVAHLRPILDETFQQGVRARGLVHNRQDSD